MEGSMIFNTKVYRWEDKILKNETIMQEVNKIVMSKPTWITVKNFKVSYTANFFKHEILYADLNLPTLEEIGQFALADIISKKLVEKELYNCILPDYNSYNKPDGHNIIIDSYYKPKVKTIVTKKW